MMLHNLDNNNEKDITVHTSILSKLCINVYELYKVDTQDDFIGFYIELTHAQSLVFTGSALGVNWPWGEQKTAETWMLALAQYLGCWDDSAHT